MTLEIAPTGEACGAVVRGVDLTQPLAKETVDEIRSAWLDHLVLVFPDQEMSDEDLERFTLYFGPFGDDPFIAPIDGHEHIIAVQRAADETAPIFAESWHTDWSFQESPQAERACSESPSPHRVATPCSQTSIWPWNTCRQSYAVGWKDEKPSTLPAMPTRQTACMVKRTRKTAGA